MTKRTTGVLKACLVVTVVLLVLLASMPVLANEPVTDVGGIEITGYRLSHEGEAVYTGPITKGMDLTVEIDVYDTRFADTIERSKDDLKPTGRVNTGSFVRTNNTNIDVNSDRWKSVPRTTDAPTPQTLFGYSYTVTCYNLQYNGIGNTFQIDLFYEGDTTMQVAPMSLTINNCVEYVEPSSSSDVSSSSSSSAVVKGTGFVLQEASYGQTTVYAGQPFTLTATLLATNGDHSVENVTVGITPPKELSLQDGSSLAYIGTVKPGQNVPAEFRLVPGANVEEGSYTAVIDIKGVDAKTGEAVTASVSISVPVVQPERFEIFSTQLPSDMFSNMDDGSGYGTITLVNQGKGAVANVAVEIVGAGLTTEEGKQYVGHVNGGEQKTADFNIKASEPGQIAAQVVVSYENTRGDKKELVYDFTLTVEDGGMMDGGMIDPMPMPEPEPQGGMPIWGWLLIALAVIAVVVVVIILLKKQKAKKAAALEDDYDEDE